jgi:hypothetical protein
MFFSLLRETNFSLVGYADEKCGCVGNLPRQEWRKEGWTRYFLTVTESIRYGMTEIMTPM